MGKGRHGENETSEKTGYWNGIKQKNKWTGYWAEIIELYTGYLETMYDCELDFSIVYKLDTVRYKNWMLFSKRNCMQLCAFAKIVYSWKL